MLIFVVFVVGVKGFEPSTPCSQSRCANRTALRPDTSFLEKRGTKVLLLAGICKFCVWKFLKILRNRSFLNFLSVKIGGIVAKANSKTCFDLFFALDLHYFG